jgi:hypothetical protein
MIIISLSPMMTKKDPFLQLVPVAGVTDVDLDMKVSLTVRVAKKLKLNVESFGRSITSIK